MNYQLIIQAIEEFSKSPQRKQFVKDSIKTAKESADILLEMMRYKGNDN